MNQPRASRSLSISTRRAARVFAASMVALAAMASCVDWDPVIDGHGYYERVPPGAFDAAVADADERRPCDICAHSSGDPGCAQYLDVCLDDEPCKILFDCSMERRCPELATQSDILNCSYPCLDKAGITDPAAPAVTKLFPMITCMQTVCGPICRGEVAGH